MAVQQVFNSSDPNHGYCVIDAPAANNGQATGAPAAAGAQGYDDANYPPIVGGVSQATNPYLTIIWRSIRVAQP